MRFNSAIKGFQIWSNKSRLVIPYPIAVGQVAEKIDATTRGVKVVKMQMNEFLKMYFNKSYVIKTADFNGSSNKGDIVLIKLLKKPPTQEILYGIEEILFKIDDVVDPITGKKMSHDDEVLKKHIESLSKSLNQNNF